MKQNINEELNYMKYLLGYKKGVVISEQETTPEATTTQQTTTPEVQGGDGCQQIEIKSPSFSNAQADHTKFVEPMTTKLNELISQNPAFKGGTITKMEIIGGASNVDGGKVTSFSLTNDYTPVEPKNTSGTGYQNNLKYATKRGELAKTTLLPILTGADYGLKIGFDPVVTPAVIDTGGVQDSNTNRKPNPGQIVIIRMTVCPVEQVKGGEEIDKLPYLKPTLIPTKGGEIIPSEETLRECYENSRIRVYYQGTAHHCNHAVYNIFANGIQLKRETGEDYASLNNIGNVRKKVKGILNDKQVGFDDAEILPGYKSKDCGRGNQCGRSNTFVLDKITNESFFNKDVLFKHNGALVITAACTDRGQGRYNNTTDCHQDVGQISFKITGMEEKAIDATDTPNMFDEQKEIGRFDACKTYTRKVVR